MEIPGRTSAVIPLSELDVDDDDDDDDDDGDDDDDDDNDDDDEFCELQVVFGFFGFCAALQAVGLCLVRYVPRPYQDRTVVKKHHVRLRHFEYI